MKRREFLKLTSAGLALSSYGISSWQLNKKPNI